MTKQVSSTYAKSQKVNPSEFLEGEMAEQAKTRIMSVVAQIVQSGLSMRDGELHFGVSGQDMADAKTALSLLKPDDTNFMRHSNDSLVNAMGAFIFSYQRSQMPLEKGEIFFGLGTEAQSEKTKQSHLRVLMQCLNNMYNRGFDKVVQPRRWDDCGGLNQRKPLSNPWRLLHS